MANFEQQQLFMLLDTYRSGLVSLGSELVRALVGSNSLVVAMDQDYAKQYLYHRLLGTNSDPRQTGLLTRLIVQLEICLQTMMTENFVRLPLVNQQSLVALISQVKGFLVNLPESGIGVTMARNKREPYNLDWMILRNKIIIFLDELESILRMERLYEPIPKFPSTNPTHLDSALGYHVEHNPTDVAFKYT